MSALPEVTGPVVVRFAPSPTGYLHLGSARTALFNWLWARHLRARGVDARFLLRIEDTDRERSRSEYVQVIYDVLAWLGIDWDGDVDHQIDHAADHDAAVDRLLAQGDAYRCDCTQEQVKARNEAAGGPPGYDGHCRARSVPAEADHVVRFAVPDEGSTSWVDLIRGEIVFEHRNLEDFVLRRSDGSPVFIVANAIDDALAGVTHVIRGEDLINVTPKMLLLRRALGHAQPIELAHLPLIVNEQRKKLSKRRDDVSVDSYRQRGFLPEAMVNYLALLGWGPHDGVEVRPLSEIVELFEITHVSPSPAMFDVRKLESVNGDHLRELSAERFVEVALPFVEGMAGFDRGVFAAIAPEVQTRVKVLAEIPSMIDFLFSEPRMDPASWDKAVGGNEAAPAVLEAALRAYEAAEWDAAALHHTTAALAEAAGLKLGRFQGPIRVALTGRSVGPPLFESMELLGRDTTLDRLRAARARC